VCFLQHTIIDVQFAGYYGQGPKATLTNAGTIIGTAGTAVTFTGGTDLVRVVPGAVFVGTVAAGTAAGTTSQLELTSAHSRGTIGGLGTSFTNFGTVTVDAGARWTLAANNTIARLADAGTVTIGGSTLAVTGVVAGVGRIAFATGGARDLVLGMPGHVSAKLAGFGIGDTIDLVGLIGTSHSFAGRRLEVEGTTRIVSLDMTGRFTTASFKLASDGHRGTDVTFVPAGSAVRDHGGTSISPHQPTAMDYLTGGLVDR
jgi:hypothetical protein